MITVSTKRDSSRRDGIKTMYKSSSKIHDENNFNCYICNDKKHELNCLICKKNICLNCSNNSFCLYCNMKDSNKHIIDTYLSSPTEKRNSELVEKKGKKRNKFCCWF
jgi:hypothetical protein